jgi:hypothetical protein
MRICIGETFGRLTVLERLNERKHTHIVYVCRCICGNTKKVSSDKLRSGHTKSCGCLPKNGPKTHGLSYTNTFISWKAMRQRCRNPRQRDYKYYGGRGITVCKRWETFENFYEDMGDRPEGYTLDRIDNNGNYEPSNCKWSTAYEQQNNRSNNILTKLS